MEPCVSTVAISAVQLAVQLLECVQFDPVQVLIAEHVIVQDLQMIQKDIDRGQFHRFTLFPLVTRRSVISVIKQEC